MIRRLPLNAARWLTLLLLVIAPWPYGFIPQWSHPWFTGFLLAIAALWIAGLGSLRRRPVVPATLLLSVTLLLFQGWLGIGNAQYHYDRSHFQFIPSTPWISSRWIPGALDTVDAIPTMVRISATLVVLCAITDMAANQMWRSRILFAIFTSGTIITLYGLAQRTLNSSLLYWDQSPLEHNYFAGFYYHGNAGAFVNLLIPLSVGYTTLAFGNPHAHVRRAVSIVSLMLLLAAEVAIASKAAMVVTGILVVCTGAVSLRYLVARYAVRSRVAWIGYGVGGIAALGAASLFGFDRAAKRWGQLSQLMSLENPRLSAWRACLRMIPDAGPWGIGPGNFFISFPHYTKGLPSMAGIWEHAHQDYLETCIEWGWWGTAVFSVIFIGALWRAGKLVFLPGNARCPADFLTPFVGLSLAGVMLHALVDFPLQIPAISLYVAAFIGILWSDPSAYDEEPPESHTGRP